ncbi:MAG: metallophosphoesterase [Mariprofundus sp.]
MSRLLLSGAHELDRRHVWATIRGGMEVETFKHLRNGGKRRYHWNIFEMFVDIFGIGLKTFGLYEQGVRNALDVRLNRMELCFESLPAAFDGYTILHLTDLHYDALTGLEDVLVALVDGLEVDFCAFTGDYRRELHGSYAQSMLMMQHVVAAIHAKDGIVATLGNHDSIHMVNVMERMGVRVLGNETFCLQRNDSQIHITGVDDVHYFYTDMVREALEETPEGFKIALVHSPEIYDLAADNAYALYLTGHTHAGQITFANGRPVIKHLNNGKHLAAGLWQHKGMTGYTSSGAGVSGIPVRYNTRGEVSLITLKRSGNKGL